MHIRSNKFYIMLGKTSVFSIKKLQIKQHYYFALLLGVRVLNERFKIVYDMFEQLNVKMKETISLKYKKNKKNKQFTFKGMMQFKKCHCRQKCFSL